MIQKTLNHFKNNKVPIEHLNPFNILIFDGKFNPNDRLQLNLQSFKIQYPDRKHTLYFHDDIQEILKKNFETDVLKCFNKVKPYAFKADLARLCILYEYGGIYSDISWLHLSPINLAPQTNTMLFKDAGLVHPPFSICNALIASRPKQKIILDLIHMFLEHIKNDFYGHHALDITGPYAIGRHIASIEHLQNIKFGEAMRTFHGKPNSIHSTKSIYMPSGKLIAIRNKTKNSSIEEFVLGGNNYMQMWKDKEVY